MLRLFQVLAFSCLIEHEIDINCWKKSLQKTDLRGIIYNYARCQGLLGAFPRPWHCTTEVEAQVRAWERKPPEQAAPKRTHLCYSKLTCAHAPQHSSLPKGVGVVNLC